MSLDLKMLAEVEQADSADLADLDWYIAWLERRLKVLRAVREAVLDRQSRTEPPERRCMAKSNVTRLKEVEVRRQTLLAVLRKEGAMRCGALAQIASIGKKVINVALQHPWFSKTLDGRWELSSDGEREAERLEKVSETVP